MMRLVFVNHSHPSMPHVSGLRAWKFALELSARGHQVVLMCEWRQGAPAPIPPGRVADELQSHDWSSPLVLAVKPVPSRLLNRVRSAETSKIIRKGLVASSYVTASGVFTDFSAGAEPYLAQLASAFKPGAVWGTFGNTDCWLIAKRLAALSGCGWVGDMKDAWDWWIPSGLRTLLARRFRSMAAATANAEFNATVLSRWFPARPTVVYSGADDEWFQPLPLSNDAFRVMLVGGVYAQQDFLRFLGGLNTWLLGRSTAERERISVCYAGSDGARVESALRDLAPHVRLDVMGYVALSELAGLCRSASVNAYLWSPTTFHHKLVELLCSRRPIISFPGEREESVAVARECGGSLSVCTSEGDVQAALDDIWRGGRQPSDALDPLRRFTWAAQADRLELVLREVAQGRTA